MSTYCRILFSFLPSFMKFFTAPASFHFFWPSLIIRALQVIILYKLLPLYSVQHITITFICCVTSSFVTCHVFEMLAFLPQKSITITLRQLLFLLLSSHTSQSCVEMLSTEFSWHISLLIWAILVDMSVSSLVPVFEYVTPKQLNISQDLIIMLLFNCSSSLFSPAVICSVLLVLTARPHFVYSFWLLNW